MDYISELNIQYVDLGGVSGVFLKLDAAQIDEHSLETLLQAAQQQIRLMVRASREGSTVHRETYSKSTERTKRSKLCHCRYCDEVYHCRSDLVAHQTKVHPNLPLRVGKKARKPCPNCGRLVLNLALHIRTKHQSDPVVNFTSGLAQCRQCEETYPINSYSEHAAVCRFSPTCPDCKKTFSQWRVMNKHRKIVHQGEKLTCPTCNKTYHDAQSLKKHVEAVHLKLKRVCPLCGATVTTLAGHMNSVHAGNRNFPCTSCDKKFKSNYDLTRHRQSVHLGQKPACPICGKRLANLDQHIRIVHKQIKFNCTLCTKQFNTRSDLSKHVNNIHGGDQAGLMMATARMSTTSLTGHINKVHGATGAATGDPVTLVTAQFSQKFLGPDLRGLIVSSGGGSGPAPGLDDQDSLYISQHQYASLTSGKDTLYPSHSNGKETPYPSQQQSGKEGLYPSQATGKELLYMPPPQPSVKEPLYHSQQNAAVASGTTTTVTTTRELSEEQLIAQYLGKQTFNLPSTPLKQEVLNDPMILCKEEQQLLCKDEQQMLSKQDLDLLGQTRINIDSRQLQDLREQQLLSREQQEMREQHQLRGQQDIRQQLETPRQQLDIQRQLLDIPRQQLDIPKQQLDIPRQQLEIPRQQLEIPRQQQTSLSRTLGLDRLEMETERHLTRIDLETERHLSRMVDLDNNGRQQMSRVDLDVGDRHVDNRNELQRIQQNTDQLRQLQQMDDKLGSELESTIHRSYQSPLLSTVHSVPSLHNVHPPTGHSVLSTGQHSLVHDPAAPGGVHPLPPWDQHLNPSK